MEIIFVRDVSEPEATTKAQALHRSLETIHTMFSGGEGAEGLQNRKISQVKLTWPIKAPKANLHGL